MSLALLFHLFQPNDCKYQDLLVWIFFATSQKLLRIVSGSLPLAARKFLVSSIFKQRIYSLVEIMQKLLILSSVGTVLDLVHQISSFNHRILDYNWIEEKYDQIRYSCQRILHNHQLFPWQSIKFCHLWNRIDISHLRALGSCWLSLVNYLILIHPLKYFLSFQD